MLRRQTLIALGVAVVLGLLAVYFANVYLTANEPEEETVAQNTVPVAVAAVPLGYGVQVTPDKIRFAQYPANSVPPGSFNSPQQVLPGGKPRIALRPMLVNEPILANKVTGEGQAASIAALLPDGKRAAAVRINDVSGVAGFIQPNDAVDVLLTRQATGGGQQQVTDVLLQNIRVIATDQKAESPDGQPLLARTATLEVTPLESQKLALAQQIGQVSLVLRKPGEQENFPGVETVSLADLRYSYYAGARPTQVAAAAPRRVRRVAPQRRVSRPDPVPPRPTTSNVQVVRGTQGNDYEVGEYGS